MEPRRQIGLNVAIALVAGELIASGIFPTPSEMAKSLGSPALPVAIWCGMAFMTFRGAHCRRFPRTRAS